MKNEVIVDSNGSGSVNFRIQVEDILLKKIEELSDFDKKSKEKGKLFDVDKIKEDFAKKPGLNLKKISSPKPSILEGEIVFSDVAQVFKNEAKLTQAGVISYQKSDGKNKLRVHLERGNFSQVTALNPVFQNSFFKTFGPEDNEGVSEEEYLDMMSIVFDEQGPVAVKASVIELKVTVKGQILSQTGGKQSGNSVVFTMPLIQVLLLNKPIDYSIVFK